MRRNSIKFVVMVLVVCLMSSIGMAAKRIPKPDKIRWFVDTIIEKEDGQQQFSEEFRKKTGIKLEIIHPVHSQYYDKLRLAFAAGDIPDAMELSGTNYTLYAGEGALLDLDKYVKASPTLRKVNKSIYKACRVNGKLYAIPKQRPDGVVTYIRQDWLNNLKLDVPTTWNEYFKVMKAFTHNDPDKDGKNDTYGVTGPGPTQDCPLTFADNYYRDFYRESTPDYFYKRGKWMDGMSQPNFKNGLDRLSMAYKEKVMDPEVFTNKTNTCRDKFTAGKCGVFTYWAGEWMQKLEETLRMSSDKSGKLTAMQPMRGSYYAQRVPVLVGIPVKTKNPDRIFKYLIDYMHDGGTGQTLFSLGVENVHWAMKNGKRVLLPALSNPKTSFVKLFIPPSSVLVPWPKSMVTIDPRVSSSNEILWKYGKIDPLQPYPESRQKLEEQITAARNEVFVKAILGQKSSTEVLAEYRKKVQALGINKVLADMNARTK